MACTKNRYTVQILCCSQKNALAQPEGRTVLASWNVNRHSVNTTIHSITYDPMSQSFDDNHVNVLVFSVVTWLSLFFLLTVTLISACVPVFVFTFMFMLMFVFVFVVVVVLVLVLLSFRNLS